MHADCLQETITTYSSSYCYSSGRYASLYTNWPIRSLTHACSISGIPQYCHRKSWPCGCWIVLTLSHSDSLSLFRSLALSLSRSLSVPSVNCGDPGTPSNAQREGDSFLYQASVVFTCNHGYYQSSGPEGGVRTCLETGLWSDTQPQCSREWSCDITWLQTHIGSINVET